MKSTKLYLLTVILVMLISPSLTAKSVPLKAKISNPTDRHLFFSYTKKGRTEPSAFRIELNESDEVLFELQLEDAKFIDLLYAGETVPFYLELDDRLEISFDATNVSGTLKYGGQGAVNNNFLAQYKNQFRANQQSEYEIAFLKFDVDTPIQEKAAALDATQYGSLIANNLSAQQGFLGTAESKVSQTLYDYLKTEITYSNATNKIIWFIENAFQFHDEAERDQLGSQLAALQGIDLQDESLLNHPTYLKFLNAYSIYHFLPHDLHRTKLYIPLYNTINENMTGRVKYHMLTELLLRVYERTMNGDLARKHFSDFANSNPYPEYTEAILNFYGGELGGTEDTMAPEFGMRAPDGKIIYLSDFKNKVIYMSFWASWCKPCIAGFKKSAVTRQKLADMGVVLLNVSIDKTEDVWRTAMNTHNPAGEHGLVLSLEDISKKYNISSIPQYYIVDKNGKFVHLSTDGQRNILEEFRVLVDK